MSRKYQLALSAELESLEAFQDFVDEASQDAGLDEKASYEIKLAVDEICTNVIQHGYEGMNPGTIVVSFQYGPRQVVVRITDYGHPFEPSEPPKPDVQAMLEGEPGGFGLYFVYQSVDSVSYETSASGNTLTLIKKFNTKSDDNVTTAQV